MTVQTQSIQTEVTHNKHDSCYYYYCYIYYNGYCINYFEETSLLS